MFRVILGIGSNVGDRLAFLRKGVEAIGERWTIHAMSAVYETEPIGMEMEALNFYNMVADIETGLFPAELLKDLKKIEASLGRKLKTHRMPREIDIDIELYKGYSYEDNSVKVPHPELENRRFVLEPLYDIAPTLVHPVSGKTIGTLLRQCTDRSRVIRTDHDFTPQYIRQQKNIDSST
jgi:2-amino-4-hydroxy-6-hydroxymethyldihydropteridine diphosphokinase